MKKEVYGLELVIDLSGCEYKILRSKKKLEDFLAEATNLTGLKPFKKPRAYRFMGGGLWGKGYSFHQFLTTSSIGGHCLENENAVILNIFSCGQFDKKRAVAFSKKFFRAKRVKVTPVYHIEI